VLEDNFLNVFFVGFSR